MNEAGAAVGGDVVATVVEVVTLDRTYPENVRSEGTEYPYPIGHPFAVGSFSGFVDVINFAVDGRMASVAATL